MAYATYDEYAAWCGCATPALSQERFSALERRAAAYLDDLTDGRMSEVSTQLACNAACACVEILGRREVSRNGKTIQSESNDGWSVAYASGAESATSFDAQLYDAARVYLGRTGLLYRGVEPC